MGMYRRGRERPTFDTPVQFVPINQTPADLSRGYGTPEYALGDWTGPVDPPFEFADQATFSARDRGERGMLASNIGVFVWDCFLVNRGCRFVHLFIAIDGSVSYRQRRTPVNVYPDQIDSDAWNTGYPPASTFQAPIATLDIERGETLRVNLIQISETASKNAGKGLPPISTPAQATYAAVTDDAVGQTFMWNTGASQEFRRTWTDGRESAFEATADAKDIASAESVTGQLDVAVTTKSLIFAHAALAPRLGSGFAKKWKAVIGGRDYDITGIQDGYAKNLYVRITAEARE